jgi:hypothetical protein
MHTPSIITPLNRDSMTLCSQNGSAWTFNTFCIYELRVRSLTWLTNALLSCCCCHGQLVGNSHLRRRRKWPSRVWRSSVRGSRTLQARSCPQSSPLRTFRSTRRILAGCRNKVLGLNLGWDTGCTHWCLRVLPQYLRANAGVLSQSCQDGSFLPNPFQVIIH